jgi:SAM-dependent methyltransferase
MYLAYGASGIKHIDECLYLYRVHGNNSCRTHNAEVQETMIKNYCKYRSQLVIRWAKDNGLRMVDLGGRFGAWPGFETVDLFDADINTDLNSDWPFADNSIGVIRASHIFEHLKSPIHTMNEAYRVLAPGGWLLIEVPSTDGRGAFQDPTHVSFWNENSFRYYTNSAYARYIRPAYTGRFQVSRIVTYDPFNDPTVPVVQADLIALKPPYDARPVGEVLI